MLMSGDATPLPDFQNPAALAALLRGAWGSSGSHTDRVLLEDQLRGHHVLRLADHDRQGGVDRRPLTDADSPRS
jgi:hypothetical protein